jgi:tartrate dehydrogenase/decarboxylase/D-malate dehydrogenase
MMLDFLGEPSAAQAIESALKAVTASGQTLTPDLGGRATTKQVTDAVMAELHSRFQN